MPTLGEDPALDAETQVPVLVGISVSFVLASVIIIVLRLYTRYILVRTIGLEDILITLATILSIGVSATTIIQSDHRLGHHIWTVSDADTFPQLKALFTGIVIYNLSQILTKLSFLMLYRRIFIDTFTQRIGLGMIAFLVVWGVAQEILVGFNCNPMAALIPERVGSCIDALTVWYLTSIMNIVTDFVVFLIPIPAILKLQLPKKRKVLVSGIFCLGFFTCIISIIRLFTLASAINTDDPSWDNVPTSFWSVVELNCGILCASLPTLRPLLRRMGGKSAESSGEGYQKQSEASKDGTRNRPAYAMHDIEVGGSQEVLKGNGAESQDCADSIDSVSQKGNADREHELSRSLYGSKKAYGTTTAISTTGRSPSSFSNHPLDEDAGPAGSAITVTAETTWDTRPETGESA